MLLSPLILLAAIAVGTVVGLAVSLIEWRARRWRDRVRGLLSSGIRHRRTR